MPDRYLTPVPRSAPGTVTWFITFGLGTPDGQLYTAVTVTAALPRAAQEERVRQAAFARYGRAWAFEYPPEEFAGAIARWGLRLREEIQA